MAAIEFTGVVDDISRAIDGVGVAVIVIGMLFAAGTFLRAQGQPPAYRHFRQQVGKAILLGLDVELKGRWPWQQRTEGRAS